MRRTFKTIAIMAMLGMTFTACQKEQIIDPQGAVVEVGTVYTVRYAVDGVTHELIIV